jgi:hypothetical protein
MFEAKRANGIYSSPFKLRPVPEGLAANRLGNPKQPEYVKNRKFYSLSSTQLIVSRFLKKSRKKLLGNKGSKIVSNPAGRRKFGEAY